MRALLPLCVCFGLFSSASLGQFTPAFDPCFGKVGPTSNGSPLVLDITDFQGKVIFAGHFDNVDGNEAKNIATFDPATGQWAELGGGIEHSVTFAQVLALTTFNGELWVAGDFDTVDGQPGFVDLARWDGTEWLSGDPESTLPSHATTIIYDLHVHEGELFAVGDFYSGTDQAYGVFRWNPGTEEWEPLYESANNFYSNPASLGSNGETLVLGGMVFLGVTNFGGGAQAGPTAWQPMPGQGNRFGPFISPTDWQVFEGRLWGAGAFNGGEPPCFGPIEIWDGSDWEQPEAYPCDEANSAAKVWEFQPFEHDSETHLFLGGQHLDPDEIPLNMIARTDGTSFFALCCTGIDDGMEIRALHAYDGWLYIGGNFSTVGHYTNRVNVARWGLSPRGPCCRPDCENDKDIDPFDYLCFQQAYSLQEPYGDYECDGDWDNFDVLAYLNDYSNGCTCFD